MLFVLVLDFCKKAGFDKISKTRDRKLYFGKHTAVKAKKFMNMFRLGKKTGPNSYRKIQWLSSCSRLF